LKFHIEEINVSCFSADGLWTSADTWHNS